MEKMNTQSQRAGGHLNLLANVGNISGKRKICREIECEKSSIDADVPSSRISFVVQKVTLTPLMPDTLNGLQGMKNTQWFCLLF